MATANTADFFGGSSTPIAKAKIYAPGDEPNPRNPGGISDNELARRREAERLKQAEEHYAKIRAEQSKARGKQIVAERKAFAKTQPGSLERAASDLGAVVKGAAKPVLAVAKNPIVQAINPAAAIAAHTTSKAAGGTAVIKGVAGKIVDQGTAAATKTAGVKPPSVSSAAKAIGKEAVASLTSVKVSVPSASQAVATAKQAASSAKAAVAAATAAPKQAVAAAAGAVKKPPVVAKPAAVVKAAVSQATSVFKPPPTGTAAAPKVDIAATVKGALAAAKANPSLRASALKAAEDRMGLPRGALQQLPDLALNVLATVPGAKVTISKQGKATVTTPAAASSAATMFQTANALQSAAANVAIVRPTAPASATIAIKPPPAASMPTLAMAATKPPAPTPSVASSIAAPSSAPPVIKPPPVSAAPPSSDVSTGPVIEGYLVTFEGRISPTRRFRAA